MGLCGSSASKMHHIMLAGIEKCGKTYFLYSRLNQFITPSTKIRTKSTESFNYEEIELGSFKVSIWDLPGKENLRMFWPNFYRSIDFSGLIYIINYDNKDTLNESVKVMHDLLSEEELSNVNVLVVLNYAKRDFDETNKNEKVNIEDLEDNTGDLIEDTKFQTIREEMKKNIYFDLIKQPKDILVIDIFDEKVTPNDHINTRNFFKKFVSTFD